MALLPSTRLINELELRFTKAAQARKPWDVEAVLDAAFYSGAQYTSYSSQTRRFETIPRPANRPKAPRVIDNRIFSLVNDCYSAAKEIEPQVEVLPTNVDSIEISKAKVGQAYLDHICFPTQANWLARRDAALFWTALCGEGWLKWTFDAGYKRPCIEACSPLEIYMQPGVKSYLDAQWAIHVVSMDPEDVYNRYGVELEASDVDSQDVLKTKILREIGMETGNASVTVKELWELPSRRHPKGRFITWAAGKILLDSEFPYVHRMLPFTQIGHSPLPGSAHYCSGTRIARPLQMELNSYHNQKTDHRKRFANGKWFIDSSMDLEQDPDDSDAQILKGDTRGGVLPPPVLIQPTSWPDSQDGQWIEESFQNAVGLHDASMGMAPGRVDSAKGIDQLQEADRGRLGEVKATLSIAMSRGFGQILSLAKQYVSEEVIVPLYSANAKQFVHAFKTSDFPAEPVVKVVEGGGLPKNKSARRQEIIAMFSAGVFGPPADPSVCAKVLQMLDFPTEMNLTGNELEEMVARNENLLMMQGIPVAPQPWQNHDLHEKIHNEQRNTAEFASAKDRVWSTFEFHMDATQAARLEEMVDEAKEQSAIQTAVAAVVPPEAAPAAPAAPGAPPLPDDPNAVQDGAEPPQGPPEGAPIA